MGSARFGATRSSPGASEAGLTATRFFEVSDEAAAALVDEVSEGDLILVKGSRGVATDKIVSALARTVSVGWRRPRASPKSCRWLQMHGQSIDNRQLNA